LGLFVVFFFQTVRRNANYEVQSGRSGGSQVPFARFNDNTIAIIDVYMCTLVFFTRFTWLNYGI